MSKINLGDKVRDTMTGFEGIAVAETKWIHGCKRITIQPQKLIEGKVGDQMTFDEPQVELIQAGAFATTGNTGGPRPEPTRH